MFCFCWKPSLCVWGWNVWPYPAYFCRCSARWRQQPDTFRFEPRLCCRQLGGRASWAQRGHFFSALFHLQTCVRSKGGGSETSTHLCKTGNANTHVPLHAILHVSTPSLSHNNNNHWAHFHFVSVFTHVLFFSSLHCCAAPRCNQPAPPPLWVLNTHCKVKCRSQENYAHLKQKQMQSVITETHESCRAAVLSDHLLHLIWKISENII